MVQVSDYIFITGRTETRERYTCELFIPRVPKTVPLATHFSDPKLNHITVSSRTTSRGKNSIREHAMFKWPSESKIWLMISWKTTYSSPESLFRQDFRSMDRLSQERVHLCWTCWRTPEAKLTSFSATSFGFSELAKTAECLETQHGDLATTDYQTKLKNISDQMDRTAVMLTVIWCNLYGKIRIPRG